MAVFHSLTLHALEAAGWTPERQVDPTPYITYLEQEGFLKPEDPLLHSVLRRFFAEFGGLRIQYLNPFMLEKNLRFDIIDDHSFDVDNVADDSKRFGKVLCPIGETDRGMSSILMASSGSVYVRFPTSFYYCGSNSHEAINAIITNAELQKIFGERQY